MKKHLYKNFDMKADETAGTISGFFSTYDRIPDSYGDIIAPGAFTDTLKAREESGHKFPLCWNHNLDQIIGRVDSVEDTETGPHFTASFFDTPMAQEKRDLVKSGVVYQFSFAYDVLDADVVTIENGQEANELKKLDLFEVSIVPIPANPRAVMTDIKAGRRNSKKDADAIRQAIALLEGVLGELDGVDDPDDGEDDAKGNAAAKDPDQSNPEKEKLLEFIKNMEATK